MFAGHFGVGLGLKRLVPSVSLGALFLAVQWVDLLWPTLLLLGLEHVRIQPGITAVTPLDFYHYPISHSLVAVIGWGALLAVTYAWIGRSRIGAWVCGLGVVSHWVLDLIVHRPDLPLVPGGGPMLGMGAWNHPGLTLVLEAVFLGGGASLYLRATRPRDAIGRWGFVGLIAFLALIQVGNQFGAPPPSVTAIAWIGQAQWLLVLWGWWIDRHREPVNRPTVTTTT